jgi:RNA polymerase sigma-70 factor (ECF subfamily)
MNESEFMRAYDEYGNAIFRHCYVRVSNRERAKDLTQECFTKTWAYISAGKEIDNIRAFLYRVANNLIIDESRKNRPVSLDQLTEDEGFEPKDERDGFEEVRIMMEAEGVVAELASLSPKHRDVITMRYLDDLGPKEIASITGESENVISVRLHRAIRELKERMAVRYNDHNQTSNG